MAVGAGLPIGIIFLFKMYLRRHYHPDGEVFSQYIDNMKTTISDMGNGRLSMSMSYSEKTGCQRSRR
ncbi:hypothetical protein I314_05401 [Cryptococcus bacillisporus CA1873]|uniref:Uncharacterized protein n=1 Tax=Cryptococcus bacillisporus CA1873 TaxID=1296111 RepID=A0ABR5B4S2_CRYGA|nr:hypothetical protein I314_05401 [Cryptococcus bacillisporus CA1873]|eukprot:KIR58562.1 hypothetical protein I314_05401 [Cryptococcus gattii CA1873]